MSCICEGCLRIIFFKDGLDIWRGIMEASRRVRTCLPHLALTSQLHVSSICCDVLYSIQSSKEGGEGEQTTAAKCRGITAPHCGDAGEGGVNGAKYTEPSRRCIPSRRFCDSNCLTSVHVNIHSDDVKNVFKPC